MRHLKVLPWMLALAAVSSTEARAQEEREEPPVAEREPSRPSEGSLWSGTPITVDWFSDLRARSVGDLVTIRIAESTLAKQAAQTDTSRESNASLGIDALFGLQNFVPADLELDNLVSAGASSDFKGGGANSRSNVLSATVTATVVEVLPNRNLVLEASRLLRVNGEEERLVLRGTVRPFDIDAANVVSSSAVAGLEVVYGGKGVLGENLKPGLLTRLVRFLF